MPGRVTWLPPGACGDVKTVTVIVELRPGMGLLPGSASTFRHDPKR